MKDQYVEPVQRDGVDSEDVTRDEVCCVERSQVILIGNLPVGGVLSARS